MPGEYSMMQASSFCVAYVFAVTELILKGEPHAVSISTVRGVVGLL